MNEVTFGLDDTLGPGCTTNGLSMAVLNFAEWIAILASSYQG